jgi:hypothetical protein
MRMLDRRRPHAEVWSATGQFSYEQDGCLFEPGGRPRDAAAGLMVETATETTDADNFDDPVTESLALTPSDQPVESLPDDELRTIVEISGGRWTTRAAALRFLRDVK